MGDVIRTQTGKIIGLVPTRYPDENAKEKSRYDAINAEADAYEKRKMKEEAAQLAAIPKGEERFVLAVEGLRKKIRQLKRAEDKRADQAARFARAAAAALAEIQKQPKQRAKRETPLDKAVDLAVKELRAKLPACFPCDADAQSFVRKSLPMSAAYSAEAAALNKFAKAARERGAAERRFWDALGAAGRIVCGSLDDDANARALVELAL